MKLCSDDKQCPYQSHFDTLYRLEAIDPGLCEGFLSQPDSKCLLKQKKTTIANYRKEKKEKEVYNVRRKG